MIILYISCKLQRLVIFIALVFYFGVCIYNYNPETLRSDLTMNTVKVQEYKNVEIFDIKKGKVIKMLQSNADIQEEANDYLMRITNIVSKYNPVPDKGYIIKIPLSPNILIQNKWLNQVVDEVFIISPLEGEPYLMVKEEGKRSLFLTFKGDLRKLNNMLGSY
jgi:hypothetical protein